MLGQTTKYIIANNGFDTTACANSEENLMNITILHRIYSCPFYIGLMPKFLYRLVRVNIT